MNDDIADTHQVIPVKDEPFAYAHPSGAIWRLDNCPAGIEFERDGWFPLYRKVRVGTTISEEKVLSAAVAEYHLAHPMEGQAEEAGRHAAVRGVMVRLGVYEKFVDAAKGKPSVELLSPSPGQLSKASWRSHDGTSDPDTAGSTLVQVCFRDGDTGYGLVHDWDQNWQWADSEEGLRAAGAIIAWRPHLADR